MPHYSPASTHLVSMGAEPRTEAESSVIDLTPAAIMEPEIDIMVVQSAYKQATHCYGDIVQIPNVGIVTDPSVPAVQTLVTVPSPVSAAGEERVVRRAMSQAAALHSNGANSLLGSMLGRCVFWGAIGFTAAYFLRK